MNDDVTSEIIGSSKYNPEGELIVVLFELCNLSCQFCAQDHSSIEGMSTIKEKDAVVANVLKILKERGKTSVKINIMGGELFSDAIEDNIFKDYAALIDKIKKDAELLDLKIGFNFVTNLVWTKKERVKELLEMTEIPLAVSYDPAGRFNSKNLELFIDNCKEFKNHIGQIGVVMTKPNIEKFIKGDAPYFDFLYENFEIVFDNYTHSQNNKLDFLLPTDKVLRDFYKFMLETYPKTYPFAEMFDKTISPMGCMRTMYVFSDNSWGPCGSYEGIVKKNNNTIPIVLSSTLEKKVESKWYSDYDCLNCEHMQRCSFSCFLNNHFYNQRTQQECWLKEVYDFIDENEEKNSVR